MVSDRLNLAREAYARKAWADAFDLLRQADEAKPLDAPDLELLAEAAALSGHDRVFITTLERLSRLLADAGDWKRAARAAFWAGFRLFSLGEAGRAAAWLQRAQKCVEECGEDCVTRGYLLLPAVHRAMQAGQYDHALAASEKAIEVGEAFGDASLTAMAQTLRGVALIRNRKLSDGIVLLDEAMLAATSGELKSIVTGIVYCTVIATCCRVFAMDRAREWTAALSLWCEAQPQMVPFSGVCMVHRAEIMQLNGSWSEAIVEARDAFRHLEGTPEREAAAAAQYQEGEIHRLRGEHAEAERCYGEASRLGREPMPGLALLRLAQGRHDQAVAAIRRVVGANSQPLARVPLLPAFVEIMLAAGETAEAESACAELDAIASTYPTEVLQAMAANARGALLLAINEPLGAVDDLRSAVAIWHKVEAPYLAARARALIARACLALGDRESAALELTAARAVFEDVGAVPDLATADMVLPATQKKAFGGLSPREMEVLRLLADGKTNRAIASELGLSPKTVDRHVGNIFNKLGVSSRAAATAAAYRQHIL